MGRLLTAYHSNKATAKGHDGHAPCHSLDKDIFHGREWKANMLGDHAKQAKSHKACRQRHSTDPNCDVSLPLCSPGYARLASLPPGLQTEVHVGEADDEPHNKSDKDTTQREAASSRDTPD